MCVSNCYTRLVSLMKLLYYVSLCMMICHFYAQIIDGIYLVIDYLLIILLPVTMRKLAFVNIVNRVYE